MKLDTALDWGTVWRFTLGRNPDSSTSREEEKYSPAFIRQIGKQHDDPGHSFQLLVVDPDPEEPEDPRQLLAEIKGAEMHWTGNQLYIKGWVEGVAGRFEDWGCEQWHREEWIWRKEKK